ncbi:tRNA pseudouridine(65) synthase TruC [Paraferrimonas sedimenticola]|uniref:tRNA pseudouridine synthase C n=1 Tax=Paraferrimonas sedimenticola TaxID=375674 RepID=A0AA37RXE1_9GAMM|nr:tRNA pseudouridine(65) synthase TruC [Paraferrimonas sedimenticola]GLP96728.1 tRNA pseudouridine(65) synthase TruC [Paraferrimonas sedimenticola]
MELQALYEDEYLIAIHKPAGLLVHRTYLARKERWFAMQLVRDMVGTHVYPVHRLDRPTSGVLLFAKSSEIAHQLNLQFQAHTIEKDYLAICRGYVTETEELDYPLKEELDAIADVHADPDKPAQEAVTWYKPLQTVELPIPCGRYDTSRFSLVQMRPLTGRKHQLRRHMKHLFHPIIGDTSHGDGRQNRVFRDHLECQRLMLIAKRLAFVHPVTGEKMVVETELEAEWLTLFERFGWSTQDYGFDAGWTELTGSASLPSAGSM